MTAVPDDDPPETGCIAYDSLNKKLGRQCKRYRAFHPKEVFGSFPGMYTKNKWGDTIPSDIVSDYFRGGIISTMAIFEAFIVDLLKEAHRLILKGKKKQLPQPSFNQRFSLFHDWDDEYTRVLLSGDGETFTDYLFFSKPMTYTYVIEENVYSEIKIGITRNRLLFEKGLKHRVNYRVKHQEQLKSDQRNSKLEDESALCAILKLFYGIRCVMAHGNAEQTLATKDGVLNDFPRCPKCDGNATQNTLVDSIDLGIHLDKYVEKLKSLNGKTEDKIKHNFGFKLDDVRKDYRTRYPKELNPAVDDILLRTANRLDYENRKIPIKDNFEKLKETFKKGLNPIEWEDVFAIIETYFTPTPVPMTIPSNTTTVPTIEQSITTTPVRMTVPSYKPAAFAYYHMCRIHHWLSKDKNDMYITYRLLVRINQFIHMLAFRIHIAVAEILIRKYKLDNGTWGIYIEEKDDEGIIQVHSNIDTKINDFEKKHEEIVKETHADDITGNYPGDINVWVSAEKRRYMDPSHSCGVLLEDDKMFETYVAVMKRDRNNKCDVPRVTSVKKLKERKRRRST